jgi:HAD superfamily hydrolase (TIGR01509 family)
MAGIRVIIYDCDGVLIDSRRANQAFYNHILRRFGQPEITPAQLTQAQFLTSREAIHLLFAGSPWLAQAQTYQETLDNAPFLPLLSLEPHIKETLSALRPSHRTAIATNRGRSLPLVLDRLGLAEFFDLTISSLDITHPKPHPECLLTIIKHFGIQPQEALYIGDAEVDRQVAAKAKVPFIAYKNPDLAAAYHLSDHLGLLAILDRGAHHGWLVT